MKTTDHHIQDLIVGYLANELTAPQEQELHTWISAAPENETYFNAWREVWFSADAASLDRYDSQKAFALFKQRMADEASMLSRKRHRRRLWYAAASIAALLVVSSLVYVGWTNRTLRTVADVVIETPVGSRMKLTLPDGTTVWLNAQSKITYSQHFGIEDRHVRLSGEGYFEVKENKALPFIVESKHLKVRDLGTKFNFKDYPGDERSIVSLTEGEIALSSLVRQDGDMILVPGQQAVLEKPSGKVSVTNAPVEASTQWVAGIITFNGEKLGDVVKDLERYYGVVISFEGDRVARRRFFGTFNPQELSLHDILDAFAATGKLRYKSHGRKVIIY